MTRNISVIDSDSGMMNVTPPRTALTRLEHVREEMARLYRHARVGKIATADAARLGFILNSLAKVIEMSELEKRLDHIEKKIETRIQESKNR